MRRAHRLFRSVLPLLLVTAPLAVGCSDPAELESEPGPQPEVLDCAVSMGEASVSEGGRARVALTRGADVTDIVVDSAPAGFDLVVDTEAGELAIEAPYGVGGATHVASLTATCGATVAPHELAIGVRRIAFEALPGWTDGIDGPAGREYGMMWIDSGDPDRLLVFGGFHYEPEQFTPANDLWEYDLASDTWTELAPATPGPVRPGGRMVEIPGERASYLYGGIVTDEDGNDGAPYSFFRFDYAPDALAFTEPEVVEEKSSGDYLPAMIFDAPRNRYITACGVNNASGYHCKVNAFHPDTGTWEKLTPAGEEKPEGRNGLFYVNDEENQRLVLFSGDMGSGGWACDCAEERVGARARGGSGPVGEALGPESPAIGRRNGAFALDPAGHRMFVWGGTPDGAKTFPGLYAFDLDRGKEGWTLVETETTPPERTSGMAVHDAARDRMIFGFGNGDGGVETDLWALKL